MVHSHRRARVAIAALLAGAAASTAATAAARTTPPTAPSTAGTATAGTAVGSATAYADPMTNFVPDQGAKPVDCKPKDGPLKAAWVYIGPINDGGWTQAHDVGRQEVQAALGDQVVTTYKENVPEGPQVAQVLEDLIKDGNTLIFGTSFGFQDAFIDVAAKHPNVCFDFATGYKTAANVGQFYGRGEDTDYLTGMAAGAATKAGKVGYVAPFPIPEVIRGINSYALGVQATHPGATLQVVWTNTWFDPAKERAAAESLIAAGVDVVASGQDSPASGEAAKAKGLPWTGYDSDQSANFPDIWLTATNYHWGAYETARAKAVLDGTWVPGNYYGGIADGFARLAPFGKLVSADTQAKILAKQAELSAKPGSHLTGPIKDQSGKERVPAGQQISFEDLMSMNYFVEGVIGEIPSS